jgi:hypothetical protein
MTGSALVMFATGNVVATMAQSQTPAKAAASPAPGTATPGQKPEATPTPPTGTIKGRLVAADGQPLMNANVMAQALTTPPAVKPTRVDSEGRFVLDELAPAAYLIFASAPGYIDQSMALGDASQWPRHLIGSNVRITMIRGGVITGRVTDAKGEPVVGVPVHATIVAASLSIISFFTGAAAAETDDRGVYRLFGLPPGQYTVSTGGSGQFGQFTASGFDNDVPTYYPSVTRDTTVPVSVRSGDETSGIDIKYKGSEGHSISGTVAGTIDASSQAGAITIFLAHAGSTSVLSLEIAAPTDPRRAFSFNGVADGEYDVLASYSVSQTGDTVVGTKRVTVRGGDVTGLELRLAPLASFTGTIALTPIKPEEKCDKRGSQVIETILNLSRDEPKKSGSQSIIAILSGGLGTLNDKGEFAMHNLESGKYRLEVKLPTESWYLSAIKLPGAAAPAPQPTQPTQPTQPISPAAANPNVPNLNAWQGVVTMKPGEKLSGVSIVVGQDAAGLRGRFDTEGAAIREGTRVYLLPVEREQTNNVLRYSETFVKSDGSFAFTNVAPGRYFILTRVEPPTDGDATPRPSAWDAAARVKLRAEAEKANTMIELKPCERVVDYTLKPGG